MLTRDAWRAFVRELTRPDSFPDRPYAAFLNQAGRGLLGYILSATLFHAVLGLTGAPAGVLWLLLIPFAVCVGIEAAQGWQGTDTLWDVFFMAWGVLLSVILNGADSPSEPFIWHLLLGVLVMLIYLAPRIMRAYG